MAVSLKTTLGYHSAEVSKQSLLSLAECNTPPPERKPFEFVGIETRETCN